MTTREDFEKWFKSVYTSPDFVARYDEYFTLNVYGEFVDWVEDRFRVWQACAAHYEAELLKRDALIAEKDKALRDCAAIVRIQNGNQHEDINKILDNAESALFLTHDSVRLVEVGEMSKGAAALYTILTDVFKLMPPAKHKLYTIVKGEAGCGNE